MEWDLAGESLCWGEEEVSKKLSHSVYMRRTSAMTVAKEKTSASLLYVPCSFKISGAVHRVV